MDINGISIVTFNAELFPHVSGRNQPNIFACHKHLEVEEQPEKDSNNATSELMFVERESIQPSECPCVAQIGLNEKRSKFVGTSCEGCLCLGTTSGCREIRGRAFSLRPGAIANFCGFGEKQKKRGNGYGLWVTKGYLKNPETS